jgi:hypothetical protein
MGTDASGFAGWKAAQVRNANFYEEKSTVLQVSGGVDKAGLASGRDYLPTGLFPSWTMYFARRIHRMP